MQAQSMARALGWLSIGLGLAELAAPREVARAAGLRYSPSLLRFLGARELAAGLAILANPSAPGGVQSRVAGDVMDLALVAAALGTARDGERGRTAATVAAIAGITALDVACARQLAALPENRRIHVRRSATINRRPEEIYGFWRDYSNLPRVMAHLESVERSGDSRWRWIARGPAGMRVEWETEETEDRSGELIAWRPVPGGRIESGGAIRFEQAPGGRGTIVRLEMEYSTPGGTLGAGIARLLGMAPEQEMAGALRRMKQMMETGEIATVQGQPAARSGAPVFQRMGGALRSA